MEGTYSKVQNHEKVYYGFLFTFNMTTPQIIGEAARDLNMDGLICYAKDEFRLDPISDKKTI